jgi:UPF0755 protein
MRRWQALAVGIMVLAALLGGGMVWVYRDFTGPGPLAESRTLIVPHGAGIRQIAQQLVEAGAIRSKLTFMLGTELEGAGKPLKAGEYAFTALQAGRIVIHHLTLAEGLTTHQILAQVAQADALVGDLPDPPPPEGSLLPETYNYIWGDARADLVERMRKAMDTELAQIWAGRDQSVPLADAQQALILASIVEKETALESERRRVAAVFLNRLKHGMRLQADPTAAYAVTHGAAPLARSLTRADLETTDPFNTYTHDGLPPGPIANPGKATLEAVVHPAKSEDLYFVADGSGGHVFAKTLGDQTRNIALYRRGQPIDPAPALSNPTAATQPAAPASADPVRPVKTLTPATPATAAARPAKTAPAQVVKGRRCQPKPDGTCAQ